MMEIPQNLVFHKKDNTNFEVLDSQKHLVFQYEYQPTYQLSIQTWWGHLKDETIIHIYKLASHFAFENKQLIKTSISHLEHITDSFHLTNEWVIKEFIPRSIEVGYRNTLFTKPADLIAQLAVEDALELLTQIEGLEKVEIFDSLAAAYAYAIKL